MTNTVFLRQMERKCYVDITFLEIYTYLPRPPQPPQPPQMRRLTEHIVLHSSRSTVYTWLPPASPQQVKRSHAIIKGCIGKTSRNHSFSRHQSRIFIAIARAFVHTRICNCVRWTLITAHFSSVCMTETACTDNNCFETALNVGLSIRSVI